MPEDERIRAIWTSGSRTPCVCRRCTPAFYPAESHGPERGEGHVTTRFGRRVEHVYTDIFLDGVKQELCVEAYTLDTTTGDGWIITHRYERPQHLCEHLCDATGHPEYCETVRYGRVTIRCEMLLTTKPEETTQP